jgi:hypothetical protein
LNTPGPRRKFLKSATLTTFSAAVALVGSRFAFGQRRKKASTVNYPVPLEVQYSPLFSYTSATFEPYVGDIFQAPNARGQMITITLLSVTPYKMQQNTRLSTKKAAQPTSFSLTFRAEARLPQFSSIHRVSHPALGEMDLFLTGYRAVDGTLYYEAVFNHIK